MFRLVKYVHIEILPCFKNSIGIDKSGVRISEENIHNAK